MVCIDQKYIKQTDVFLHFRIYDTEQQIWHKRIWYNGARNTMFQRIQKYKRTKGHKTKQKKKIQQNPVHRCSYREAEKKLVERVKSVKSSHNNPIVKI